MAKWMGILQRPTKDSNIINMDFLVFHTRSPSATLALFPPIHKLHSRAHTDVNLTVAVQNTHTHTKRILWFPITAKRRWLSFLVIFLRFHLASTPPLCTLDTRIFCRCRHVKVCEHHGFFTLFSVLITNQHLLFPSEHDWSGVSFSSVFSTTFIRFSTSITFTLTHTHTHTRHSPSFRFEASSFDLLRYN